MATIKRLTGGRAWVARLSVLFALGAIVALIMAVFPAAAGDGGPSGNGVQPTQIRWGGGPGGCQFIKDEGIVSSIPPFELHINNPSDTVFTHFGTGTTFEIKELTNNDDEIFNYDMFGGAAQYVIVNGGKQSTLYDYTPGSSIGDTGMHAPSKGNSLTNLFKVSHITVCFDIVGFVEGNKSLDSDADGTGDVPVLGWTIQLLDQTGAVLLDQTTTDINGDYSFAVQPGNYTVCEDLPAPGTTVWHQSFPTDIVATDGGACGATNGYSVTVVAGTTDAGNDFANFETATVSGIKWHDRRPDGDRDDAFEGLLSGWTINAFVGTTQVGTIEDSSGTAVGLQEDSTDGSGYTLTLLVGNTYSICEIPGGAALPDGFSWAQSDLSTASPATWTVAACGSGGTEDDGHSVSLSGNKMDIDFGNHKEGSFCVGQTSGTDELILEESGIKTTVTATCKAGTATSVFDQGINPNPNEENPFSQFTVFEGTPDGTQLFFQTIEWAPEDAVYLFDPPVLQVPVTARLDQFGDIVPVVFCGPGDPDTDGNSGTGTGVFDCLRTQQINLGLGAGLPADKLQVIEDYEFAGDPPRFR